MSDSIIDLSVRRTNRDWLVLRLESASLSDPVAREFLVDTKLPAMQVVDLLAVGMGFDPSPTMVLERRQPRGMVRYAARGKYHFDGEPLWDATELSLAEVLRGIEDGEVEFRLDIAPTKGWRFTLEGRKPTGAEVEATVGPFNLVDQSLPLLSGNVPAVLYEAYRLAQEGRAVPPHLQMALLRDTEVVEVFLPREFNAHERIKNYFQLAERGLTFPWFALLEAYATRSPLLVAAIELLDVLKERGKFKLLKNGLISLPDARKVVEGSVFFAEQWNDVPEPIFGMKELRRADQVPGLIPALESLREAGLVEVIGQSLTAVASAFDEDGKRAMTVELFIADINSGHIASDWASAYPMPEQILEPHPDAHFSLEPDPGDFRFDSFIDDPAVKRLLDAVVSAMAPGGIPPEEDPEEDFFIGDPAELSFFGEGSLAADPAVDPGAQDETFQQIRNLFAGGAADSGAPGSIFGGGFNPFFSQAEQMDDSVLPGRRSGGGQHDLSGEVRHIEFEIALDDVAPRVSRVMQLPVALDTEYALQLIILLFGWDLSHLYDLSLPKPGTRNKNDRVTLYPDFPGMEPMGDYLWAKDVELGQVLTPGGPNVRLDYDYGDSWTMRLKPRKTVQREAGAHIIRASQACPPEDIGGVGGYTQVREILSKGPKQAAAADPYLDLEWAEELAEIFGGLDPKTPQFGPGTYPLRLEQL